MPARFTVFIDESGEAGIGKVRSEHGRGASPYMTLGGALVQNEDRETLEDVLEGVRSDLRKKTLHCSELKHYQILHFARQISRCRLRMFGIISHKNTLRDYKNEIDSDSNKYYNKCIQYILERVGWFMECRGIPPENLDIVLEEGNFDYKKMTNFLRICQQNPHHPFTKKLQNVDLDNIQVKKKAEEPLLEIADLVAHALYKCVDKSKNNFGIPEPRYLCEISTRFFGHPDTLLLVGGGLHCVHQLRDLKLDHDVETVMSKLIATAPSSAQ